MSPTPRIYLALLAATLGTACAADVGDPDPIEDGDMDDTIVDEGDDEEDDDSIEVPADELEITAGEVSGSQVCIYDRPAFQGHAACWGGLLPGERATIPNLFEAAVGNDQAYSFKVKRGVKVSFYSDVDRRGARYSANGYFGRVWDPDMNIGDKPVHGGSLSSMVITRMGSTARAWDDDDWQVCMYSDADYGGTEQCWGGVPDGKTRGLPTIFHTAIGNDRASSVAVNDGVVAIFFSDVDRHGAGLFVDGRDGVRGVRDLGASPLGNDHLSSFLLTP
ncbi:MAG TPA: peptidase inhibitor family I36 protein [Kofleriaceae bacterium]|nr:peptidase inhibitor family I36 protein [Kofleriaceae bacterium]